MGEGREGKQSVTCESCDLSYPRGQDFKGRGMYVIVSVRGGWGGCDRLTNVNKYALKSGLNEQG